MSFDYSLSINIPRSVIITFLAAIGSCIGSFLNVVIYRIPRGLSIVSPPSSCPYCNNKIRWFDNIPVISYLLLAGKCRFCKSPISPRYTLVEIATAIAFVALYDAFYVMKIHSWFSGFPFDLPIFIAHLGLVAILIVCSAIDIEYYLIDIRITFVAFALGIICWMITPTAKLVQISGTSVINSSCFAGIIGAIIGLAIRNALIRKKLSQHKDTEYVETQDKTEELTTKVSKPVSSISRSAIIFLAIYLIGALVIVTFLISGNNSMESYKIRLWAYCIWLFLAIIAGSVPKRESDEQIVQAIEEEKYSARAVALTEFIYLTPVIAGFIVFWAIARYISLAHQACYKLLMLQVGIFSPVKGIAFSLTGILITAAFGWFVRIIFTLVFGKEAMGPGDIYILSAIGAIAGPAVAILGFFLGSVIGVFGICVLLLWKTSRALSYGPWISMGAFVCMLGYDPIMNYLKPAAKAIAVMFSNGGR